MNELTAEEQKILLSLARDTLKSYLKKQKTPDIENNLYKLTTVLNQKLGVFVSLHKAKELRGCIGYIVGQKPLYEGVIENTVNAAVHDPRFYPMTLEEEPQIHIELSVLSPLQQTEKPENILVGKHGVYLIKNGYSAVFLPQVAPEQGWDRKTMLEQLCLKAGLDKNAWNEETQFYLFTAQVFSEENH
jgi:AmmeMemoRadiSam system protein A